MDQSVGQGVCISPLSVVLIEKSMPKFLQEYEGGTCQKNEECQDMYTCTHDWLLIFQPDIENESSLVEPGMIFAWFRALSSAEKFE